MGVTTVSADQLPAAVERYGIRTPLLADPTTETSPRYGMLGHGGMGRPTQDGHAFRLELAEPLLNAHQVARLLAVPASSVYEYARRTGNPLPSIAVGRHRRFYRSDVQAWLASMRG